jgi:hypothetical protein
MVTGFSVVLYSRLSLIQVGVSYIKWARVLIIGNAVIFHTLTILLMFGSYSKGGYSAWTYGYWIMEKVELTAFFVQEAILSITYLIYVHRLTFPNSELKRRIMSHTLFVNIMILVLDASLLGVGYMNNFTLLLLFKALTYSIKLKSEFYILNSITSGIKDSGRLNSAVPKLPSSDYSPNLYDRSRKMSVFSESTLNPPALSVCREGTLLAEGYGRRQSLSPPSSPSDLLSFEYYERKRRISVALDSPSTFAALPDTTSLSLCGAGLYTVIESSNSLLDEPKLFTALESSTTAVEVPPYLTISPLSLKLDC